MVSNREFTVSGGFFVCLYFMHTGMFICGVLHITNIVLWTARCILRVNSPIEQVAFVKSSKIVHIVKSGFLAKENSGFMTFTTEPGGYNE